MNNRTDIKDLRQALKVLEQMPGELVQTDVAVEPLAELAGVYRHVGAGGTVMRPTRSGGPAMIFNNVNGHPGARVLIGLLASRKRVGYLLGEAPERLGFLLNQAVEAPIPPVEVPNEEAPCQEVIHLASDPDFDIRKLVPAPTNTEEDAGPYLTFAHCYASDPETGESDITIHRLCLQSKDELSMYLVPGRHLEVFIQKAEAAGKPLPISISIGVDPAIEIASCFEPPTTPLGYNELGVAGAIRGEGVKLTRCRTVNECCIANAEYVLEGEVLPGVRCREDQNTNTGKAMPEFPGYTGPAKPSIPVIKIKAVTTRKNPIMQTCIGPSEEHVSMAGIPTEASIISMVNRAMPGKLQNVYCASCGGGKYVAILQFKKSVQADEGRHRQAALLAFSSFSELKHVFLVDEDVDPFDISDVMWAMTTRFQADRDIVTIPGVRCHPLDPSSDPEYFSLIGDRGIACKAIFDCTVPFNLKDKFQRCKFKDVDPSHWLPELFEKKL